MATQVLQDEDEPVYPGKNIRFTITCVDPDDGTTPVDPASLTVKHKGPDGAVDTLVYGTDAEIVRTGVGSYYVDLQPDAPGEWFVRQVSEAPTDVAEYWYQVAVSAFPDEEGT